jgi:hypothetical protein
MLDCSPYQCRCQWQEIDPAYDLMSAYGTKQTLMQTMSMSASGGKPDIPDPLSNVG